MAYTPRGKVKIILDHMASQDPSLEWSAEELAQAGDIDKMTVSNTMRVAIRNEVMFAERRGRSFVYSLTPFAKAPEEVVEPVPFNAARWADGDVFLYGLEEMADGSHRLPADKVGMLLQLLGGLPA